MIRALVIDAKAREVREIELPENEHARLAAMNEAIGGYLELAYIWPLTGDTLFVDEDGIRHDWRFGFILQPRTVFPPAPQVLGGGIVVGRECEGAQYPGDWTNLDPVITADELRALVRFFER